MPGSRRPSAGQPQAAQALSGIGHDIENTQARAQTRSGAPAWPAVANHPLPQSQALTSALSGSGNGTAAQCQPFHIESSDALGRSKRPCPTLSTANGQRPATAAHSAPNGQPCPDTTKRPAKPEFSGSLQWCVQLSRSVQRSEGSRSSSASKSMGSCWQVGHPSRTSETRARAASIPSS